MIWAVWAVLFSSLFLFHLSLLSSLVGRCQCLVNWLVGVTRPTFSEQALSTESPGLPPSAQQPSHLPCSVPVETFAGAAFPWNWWVGSGRCRDIRAQASNAFSWDPDIQQRLDIPPLLPCLITIPAGPPNLKGGTTVLVEKDSSGVGLPVSES